MDAAPTDGTPTTVVLLKNVVERVAVHANRNIIFDFPGLALTNDESAPVIEILNTGKDAQGRSITGPSSLTMNNGTIVTTSRQAGVNADLGGLEIGNIITEIDNTKVSSADTIKKVLNKKEKGDKVTLKIKYVSRNEYKEKEITVTLN